MGKKSQIFLLFLVFFNINSFACPSTATYVYCGVGAAYINTINTGTIYNGAAPECATILTPEQAWSAAPSNAFYLIYTYGADWFFGLWTFSTYTHCKGDGCNFVKNWDYGYCGQPCNPEKDSECGIGH